MIRLRTPWIPIYELFNYLEVLISWKIRFCARFYCYRTIDNGIVLFCGLYVYD